MDRIKGIAVNLIILLGIAGLLFVTSSCTIYLGDSKHKVEYEYECHDGCNPNADVEIPPAIAKQLKLKF